MALVSSVDYAARRIYLSASSAVSGATLDTLDVYREVLALRKSTAAHRRYLPIISAAGNAPKITGLTYTAAAARLLRGCRIVPYNGSHTITLVRDTYTDDGFANADCFDLSPLSVGVEINIVVSFDKVEIREVATGAGPTAADIAAATWSHLIEGALSAEAVQRITLAALAGPRTGMGTGSEQYFAQDATTPRITLVADDAGNGTPVLNGA